MNKEEQNLNNSETPKLSISDVSCSICKSCEREICPRCDSRLIKYKVVDANGVSLNRNSYINQDIYHIYLSQYS